jgi:ribonuclease G
VPLPSGGEIIIDETEALIAIDVNTGSHKQRSGDEKNTLFAVNMEAAIEISRQIRLRNLGGLIILDFIDMKERRHRNAVYEKMVELMSTDKAKTHILPISQLGIMQMTRQRQQESLSSNLYTDCPYCRGRGMVKSATTMSVELQRKLSSVVRRLQARGDGKEYSLRVLVHPGILERLRSEDAELLVRMEKLFGVKLAFRADPAYHVENFKIINALTGEEYR